MHLDYESQRTRQQPSGIGLVIRLLFFGTIGTFGLLLLLASAFGRPIAAGWASGWAAPSDSFAGLGYGAWCAE